MLRVQVSFPLLQTPRSEFTTPIKTFDGPFSSASRKTIGLTSRKSDEMAVKVYGGGGRHLRVPSSRLSLASKEGTQSTCKLYQTLGRLPSLEHPVHTQIQQDDRANALARRLGERTARGKPAAAKVNVAKINGILAAMSRAKRGHGGDNAPFSLRRGLSGAVGGQKAN